MTTVDRTITEVRGVSLADPRIGWRHHELEVGPDGWHRITEVGLPFVNDGTVRVYLEGVWFPLAVPNNATVRVREVKT